MAQLPACVLSIACGASHTVALLTGNRVCSWGRSEDGQLGHGDAEERHVPYIVDALQGSEISQVSCGADHTVAYSATRKTVYSWGWGDFGRLGHGSSTDSFIPTPIQLLRGISIRQVVCGDCHCLAVTEDGIVYSWGRNQNGQLGLGGTVDALLPQKIAALAGIKVRMVAAGAEHTAAITEDGRLFGWGWNHYGNLGLGDRSDRKLPELVSSVQGERMIMVACGWRHTIALTALGKVYTMGWSKYGQLGHADNKDHLVPHAVDALMDLRVVQIAGGWRHSVAITSDGALFTWGWNKFGQLGLGKNEDQNSPWLVTSIKEPVSLVTCGWRHTVAVTEKGNVYSWGRGAAGQLGHGDAVDRNAPKLLGLLSTDGLACTQIPCARRASFASRGVLPSDRYAMVPDQQTTEDDRAFAFNAYESAVPGATSSHSASREEAYGVQGGPHVSSDYEDGNTQDWFRRSGAEVVAEARTIGAMGPVEVKPVFGGTSSESRGRNGAEVEMKSNGGGVASEGSMKDSRLRAAVGEGMGAQRLESANLHSAKALVGEGYGFDGGGRQQPEVSAGLRLGGIAVGPRSDAGPGPLGVWAPRTSASGIANVADGVRRANGGAAMPTVAQARMVAGGGRGGMHESLVDGGANKKENLRGKRKCPSCSSMIAAAAADCSHCGHMFRPSKWNKQRASMLSLGCSSYTRVPGGNPPGAAPEEASSTPFPQAESKPHQVNDMLAAVVQVAGWRKKMDGGWLNPFPGPRGPPSEAPFSSSRAQPPEGPFPGPRAQQPEVPFPVSRAQQPEVAFPVPRSQPPEGAFPMPRPQQPEGALNTSSHRVPSRPLPYPPSVRPPASAIAQLPIPTSPNWLVRDSRDDERQASKTQEDVVDRSRTPDLNGRGGLDCPSLELQLHVSSSKASIGSGVRETGRHYVVPDEQTLEFLPDSQVSSGWERRHPPILRSLDLFPTQSEASDPEQLRRL